MHYITLHCILIALCCSEVSGMDTTMPYIALTSMVCYSEYNVAMVVPIPTLNCNTVQS